MQETGWLLLRLSLIEMNDNLSTFSAAIVSSNYTHIYIHTHLATRICKPKLLLFILYATPLNIMTQEGVDMTLGVI